MSVRLWYLLGTLFFMAFVALGVVVADSQAAVDLAVRDLVGARWEGDLGTAAAVLSAVLGPTLPVLLGVALLGWTAVLRWHSDPRAGVTFRILLLLGACRLTSVLAKPVFGRQRPREYNDLSYPSGHVASVAATGFAAVLLCVWFAPRLVSAVRRVAVAATLLACGARIAYGVHWVTDTVGSVLGVIGVGFLAAPALRLLPPPQRGPGKTGA